MSISVGPHPEVVLDCRHNLGESVLWDDRTSELWWVDIHQGRIWSWTPFEGGAPQSYRLAERVGAIAFREGGGLCVALEGGFARFDPATGVIAKIADVEPELATTRLNDGRVDAAGRFVCGGMDEASPQRPISAVYTLEVTGTVRQILGGVSCTNSICWSPDGATLYLTDMPTRRIEAFDYSAEGILSGRRTFADLATATGLADGSTVDAEGYLWNAEWGGGKVVRYAPDGRVDREIGLPVSNPTCLAFGGENLDVLFISTAWFGLSDEARARQPLAGSIFALRPGVRGRPEHRFRG